MVRHAVFGMICVAAVLGASAAGAAAPAVGAPCGHWTAIHRLVPSESTLSGVGGSAATDVWAVGSQPRGRSSADTVIEHWDGSGWSRVPSPRPAGADKLFAVAAASPAEAWAVGHVGSPGRTFILHWEGAHWTIAAPPTDARHATLFAVSVVSASDVWAVGENRAGQPLTLHFDGVAWSRVPSPDPRGVGVLRGVAAIAPNDVWAVGSIGRARFSFAEHWDGAGWHVVGVADVGHAHHGFDAVTARSSSDVWAVGGRRNQQVTIDMVQHWDGSHWTNVIAREADVRLLGVALSGPTDIWAVGLTDHGFPYAEHRHGVRWQASPGVRETSLPGRLSAITLPPGSATFWTVGTQSHSPVIESRC